MPEIDLGDFSEVGKLPPEGVYRVSFPQQAKVLESKDKKSHNIVVDWVIQDAPTGAENFENFTGKVWFSLKPEDNTRKFLKRNLGAVFQTEIEGELKIAFDDDDVLDRDVFDFESATALVTLTHGEYNGEPQANVKNWIPDDGETEPAISESSYAEGEEPF